MRKTTPLLLQHHLLFLLLCFSATSPQAAATADDEDAAAMLALKKSLAAPDSLGWSDPDPCKWSHVVCSESNRVTRIQIGHQGLQGTLPTNLNALTQLERLELQFNSLSGSLDRPELAPGPHAQQQPVQFYPSSNRT